MRTLSSYLCAAVLLSAASAHAQDEESEDPYERPRVVALRKLSSVHEEPDTVGAMVELTIGQTVHGLAQGLLLCSLLQCNDGGVTLGLGVAGAALGAGVSFGLTRDGIRPGQAMAVNAGSVWGAVDGGLFLIGLGSVSSSATGGIFMLSSAVGAGAGAYVAIAWSPRAGTVALANSGGIWFSVLTFIVANSLISSSRTSSNTELASAFLAGNLGLVAGGVVGHFVPVSRAHAFIMDVGALAGLLLGVGVSQPLGLRATNQAIFEVAWAAAGYGMAGILTRNFDHDDPDLPPVTVLPAAGGHLGLTFAAAF